MPEKQIPQSIQSEQPSISNCPYGPVKCKDCGEEQYPIHFTNPYTEAIRWFPATEICDNCEKIKTEIRNLEEFYAYAGLDARHKTMIFENFKTLTEQARQAWIFLSAYAFKSPLPTANVFIFGPVGIGKTHLSCAVVNSLIQQKRYVRFRTTVGLLKQIKETFGPKSGATEEQIIWRLTTTPLLVLDDIGVERPTDWVKEIIYYIIDERYNSLLPILATSNYSLGELSEKLDDRIASRLSEGRIMKLDGRDYRPGRV